MKRALLALSVLVTGATAGAVSASPPPNLPPALRAGAAVVDATWHVGASAGQYASDPEPDPTDPLRDEWDPNVQATKKAPSYGVASRLSIRALVLQSSGGEPVALVKTDNYLTQDVLTRRAAQLLDEQGSAVSYEHLLVSSTHSHSSPYYATPAAGVWLFQDVMDLRMLEYQARAIASAVRQAETRMRPAAAGATTVPLPDFHGNIAGAAVSEDGSPAGYPLGENDHGLTLLRVDGTDGRPIGTWVSYAQHGESLDGYDLLSADWVAPFQRYLDRATGAPVVFAQGAVGSAEGPYLHAYPAGRVPTVSDGPPSEPEVPAVWAHLGYAQAERGAHVMARAALQAWHELGDGHGDAPLTSAAPVQMLTHWVAGPVSHPYPAVSNCRSGRTVDGDPGVPVVGLPDCARASDNLGAALPADGLFDALRATGVPVPDSYDAPSFGAVEENLRLKLQAVRIGDTVLLSCACEPQSDLIKALETRTDDVPGNRWDGFDYGDQAHVSAAWPGKDVRACFRTGATWSCPDPRDVDGVRRLEVPAAAYERMQAQVHNPADGWDDPAYAPYANSEPADLTQVKGNFSRHELDARCGYRVSVGVGHTGDYNGYTVSYREFQARDSYRKALTSYGPHTADYMVTRLTAMAQNLRCGTPLPTGPTEALAQADEQRQAAAAAALGRLSSAALDGWSAQVPDSEGPARAIAPRTTDITRFQAATFHWVGGDNWTDNPVVVVERQGQDGRWSAFATQDGEVQVALDQPGGIATALAEQRRGTQRWTWTASFEAFDAWPRATVSGGQTPSGSYRFVVEGRIHQSGTVSPYRLVSPVFEVSAWQGLTAHSPQVRPDGSVAFATDLVEYPRSYPSPIRFVRPGTEVRAGDTFLCKTCAFRPWARDGHVVSALVTVLDRHGRVVRTVPATGGPRIWSAETRLHKGQTAVILPGGLRDGFGETNGAPVPLT